MATSISRIYASNALQAQCGQAGKPQATQAHARKARRPSVCVVRDADGREVRTEFRKRRVKWEGDWVAR